MAVTVSIAPLRPGDSEVDLGSPSWDETGSSQWPLNVKASHPIEEKIEVQTELERAYK
jgi:hypothetical protein